jgi:hypothetical protein
MARAQAEWRNRRFRPQAHQAREMVEEGWGAMQCCARVAKVRRYSVTGANPVPTSRSLH